jgi:hypothetical protein
MAADTPVVVAPDGESGIRLDSTLMALKTPYSGAGTQSEVHWRVGAESGMTTILWETLLRENDDHWLGDDWVEIPLALIALSPDTTYHLDVRVRNTIPETSSYATSVSFTTEDAAATSARWRDAQV